LAVEAFKGRRVKEVSRMDCVAAVNAGAYMLGSLSPTDRREFEDHLTGCVECRREVAHLAVVPGLLARLEPGTVRAIAGDARTPRPAEVTESILSGVLTRVQAERAAHRRRHRWQAIGAGLTAAMLAVTAAVITNTLDETKTSTAPTTVWLTAMYPVVNDTPINAEVALVPIRGGSLVTLHCTYRTWTGSDPPGRQTLGLVIFARSENRWEQVA
jgi:hypothetical protein